MKKYYVVPNITKWSDCMISRKVNGVIQNRKVTPGGKAFEFLLVYTSKKAFKKEHPELDPIQYERLTA